MNASAVTAASMNAASRMMMQLCARLNPDRLFGVGPVWAFSAGESLDGRTDSSAGACGCKFPLLSDCAGEAGLSVGDWLTAGEDMGYTMNTLNSRGPCTPMVSVISMSAVRDGPLTKTIVGKSLNPGRRRASTRV